jgi:hypothetical protein
LYICTIVCAPDQERWSGGPTKKEHIRVRPRSATILRSGIGGGGRRALPVNAPPRLARWRRRWTPDRCWCSEERRSPRFPKSLHLVAWDRYIMYQQDRLVSPMETDIGRIDSSTRQLSAWRHGHGRETCSSGRRYRTRWLAPAVSPPRKRLARACRRPRAKNW